MLTLLVLRRDQIAYLAPRLPVLQISGGRVDLSGYPDEGTWWSLLSSAFLTHGIRLDGIRYCPYSPHAKEAQAELDAAKAALTAHHPDYSFLGE